MVDLGWLTGRNRPGRNLGRQTMARAAVATERLARFAYFSAEDYLAVSANFHAPFVIERRVA